MEQIPLAERATRITPDPDRSAGAAVASVHHREHGDCLVVLRRADGRADLPWAEVEDPEDRPQDAALQALCTTTGTGSLRWTIKPGVSVGTWTDESGVVVEGFAVRVSDLFAQMAGLDVSFLPWRQVAAAELTEKFHEVADHALGSDPVAFESPTLTVKDPVTGQPLTLSGLSGALVARWRHRVMPGG